MTNKSVAKRKSPIECNNGSTKVQDLEEENSNEVPIGRKVAKEMKKMSLSSDDSSFSTNLSNLRDEKKKAHDEKMLNYNSTTEQRAELLEIQKRIC
ncbi:hypothetical protein LIER_35314 [Lithospermum erythrorhizon]|uniref:Uncharacterized protein n=1 Tax=Lithospermum erythrorhizon TaxID=34254 RepID=A0AAV3NQ27_LITER